MRIIKYLWDKITIILINVTAMMALTMYLIATGDYFTKILLIIVAWCLILCTYLMVNFHKRRKYFNEINNILNELDKRYLIGEVFKETQCLEDRLYHEIIRKSNKSVIEEIHKIEDSKKEYKEYIESWIHDVKSPVTAIGLICENNKDEMTRKILGELLKIENQVENVLYYARSEETYKDFLIHKVNLKEVVMESVRKNKLYFIQKKMCVDVLMEDLFVSSDEKWIEFLLNQIFINAIKYAKNEGAHLKISQKNNDKKVSLIIEDNGIGIKSSEVSRVFEKGFTGSNGRIQGIEGKNKATGIGLYLCSQLCEKLNLGITCESKENEFTRVTLVFPDSKFMEILQK